MGRRTLAQLVLTLTLILIPRVTQAQSGNINGVLYVGGPVNFWIGSSDIGAQINAAYAALPATGGTIVIIPPASGGCYDYSTPIVFAPRPSAPPGKYVRLEAGGSGKSACLNYKPTSGSAITLDYAPGTNIPQNTNHGLRNILLVNNNCFSTDGCGSSAIGINTGGTYGGSTYAVFENVVVSGFSIGYRNLNTLSVGQVWQNPSFSNNGIAQQFSNIAQSIRGGTFAGNITVLNAIAANGPELVVTDTFFFANNLVLDATAALAPAAFACTHCHFENTPAAVNAHYINGNVNFFLSGGVMEDENSSGTNDWMVNASGNNFVIDGMLFVAVRTNTQIVKANSPVRGILRGFNASGTQFLAYAGGANAAFVTVEMLNGSSANTAQPFAYEKLSVGGGATLNLYKTVSDLPGAITVNAHTCTDRAVTLAGALPSAVIVPTANYAMEANISLSSGQAVAGTVHYRICNVTDAIVTLSAGSAFNLAILQ
jgi:hypothetical protein